MRLRGGIRRTGVQLWNNGTAYFGEWHHDQIEGKGIYFIPPKTIIQGNFVGNKLNGVVYVKTR